MTPHIGKLIVLLGVVLILIGAAIWGLSRTGFRGLPGDIRYDTESGGFYFPIVTCLVLSLLLSLGLWLWRWISRG